MQDAGLSAGGDLSPKWTLSTAVFSRGKLLLWGNFPRIWLAQCIWRSIQI